MATPNGTIVTREPKPCFSILAQDGGAHGVVYGLKHFLLNHKNSAVHGDTEALRIVIHICTLELPRTFSMHLSSGRTSTVTRIRFKTRSSVLPMGRLFYGIHYVSEMEAQENGHYISLEQYLTGNIPALADSLESSAVRAVSEHISRKQASDFEFWRGSTGMKLSVSSSAARTIPLKLHRTSRTSPMDMLLTVTNTGAKNIEALTIADLGIKSRLIPLSKWLDQYFYAHQDSRLTKADWKYDWEWNEGNLIFRFLEFPPELRISIYEYTVGHYICPRFRGFRSFGLKDVYAFRKHPSQQEISRRPPQHMPIAFDPLGLPVPYETALPLVSKQVREEYLKVLWESTSKHFQQLPDILGVITILNFSNFEGLRSISLGLSNYEFYKLLGVHAPRYGSLVVESTPQIKTLFKIKTLTRLNFHFQIHPPHDQLNSNMLLRWDHKQLSHERHDPYDYGRNFEASCQKTMVDWILTFAFEHIRHVPGITISGHVKNSTRQEWESVFENVRRGEEYDMSGRIASLLSLTSPRQSHVCICARPCNWWLENGPYPEALEFRNNRGRCPFYCGVPEPGEPLHDPKVHDLFSCED